MTTSLDVINRALQKLGKARIASLGDMSLTATETNFSYQFLKRAELRRNVWRFSIRNVAIRAVDGYTQQLTFAAWASGTSYALNDIVTGSDSQIYRSLAAANSGHDPTSTAGYWALYCGPNQASPFASTWSASPTYVASDVVLGSDANYYLSLAAGNINHNPVGDLGVHWELLSASTSTGILPAFADHGLTFYSGELVYAAGAVYLSLVSGNTTDPTTDTTASWLTLTSAPTLTKLAFIYPIGSGPRTDKSTRNVFMLPNGFLREAPQAPKSGQFGWLGAPAGLTRDDWNFENQCFTSSLSGPVILRFAADIGDASQFDPMFIEGLACRISLEHCEQLTGSTAKLSAIDAEYRRFMTEARMVNGIETGPVDTVIDEYIACRA